ncbi:septum formation family protein [Demequina sp. NBRC 110054]|uniref:septum formation family protein n=1 Tax=Demequina sp. NBRC 110054 TaxID=1570343 RepID=UPI00135666CB|nr:septum formation family protein [Demequina sp. NBRC 110054]
MRALAPLAVLGLATATLTGCSTIQGIIDGPVLQDFAVGECLDTDGVVSGDETEVGTIPVVECTEAHDAEVYYVTDTTLTEFDEEALFDEVTTACLDEFQAYVGVAYDDSSIYYSAIYPTQDSWDIEDRQLVCLLTVDEDVTQSFQGSGV